MICRLTERDRLFDGRANMLHMILIVKRSSMGDNRLSWSRRLRRAMDLVLFVSSVTCLQHLVEKAQINPSLCLLSLDDHVIATVELLKPYGYFDACKL